MTRAAPISIGISGALGRMGQVTAGLVRARPDMTLAALIDQPAKAGEASGGLELVSAEDALPRCQVIIDFSTARASAELARLAAGRGAPALVIGSTGFSPSDERVVKAASKRIAIIKSGNYSLGVNLLLGMVELASRALSAGDFDIEVFEAHHRRKLDAPSGTALMLGEAAARGRGIDLAAHSERARDGMAGPRGEGAIGFSVMRGGGIVGEHSVVLAAEDEIITFSHSARDRSLFARGALAAARWVAGKPAGLYDMQDVLGLRSPRA